MINISSIDWLAKTVGCHCVQRRRSALECVICNSGRRHLLALFAIIRMHVVWGMCTLYCTSGCGQTDRQTDSPQEVGILFILVSKNDIFFHLIWLKKIILNRAHPAQIKKTTANKTTTMPTNMYARSVS